MSKPLDLPGERLSRRSDWAGRRLMRGAAIAALWAVLLSGPGVAAAAEAGLIAAASPAQAVWLRYGDTWRSLRQKLLASEFARDPIVRAQGLYWLQSLEAVAFNMYVAPRQQYPALYTQSIYMPYELSWGAPNPDFLYHAGFIDGAHTYRIYGNKKGGFWGTLQVFRGFWGDEAEGSLANIDFDNVPSKPNGDFEIFLGPNPPAQSEGRYWVKLDPALHDNYLLLRETFNDWSRDQPMDVHIEILDRDPGAAITLSETELAARIDRAGKFARKNWEIIYDVLEPDLKNDGGGLPEYRRNRYFSPQNSGQWGGNPLACYGTVLYDIKPDEALIIDMPSSSARYWGVQLASVWQQTTEYSYHQSSLNGAQARPDPDGRIRAVLALKDPGVPNWLDPVGVPMGVIGFRWYRGGGCMSPEVTVVKLAELRAHLPERTPVITPAEREAAIDARRRAALRRYGQ